MAGCLLLNSATYLVEGITGEFDDVEGVHHRPGSGNGFGGGGVVAGEPVHRDHLDSVSKHLVTGVEPLGEHLR